MVSCGARRNTVAVLFESAHDLHDFRFQNVIDAPSYLSDAFFDLLDFIHLELFNPNTSRRLYIDTTHSINCQDVSGDRRFHLKKSYSCTERRAAESNRYPVKDLPIISRLLAPASRPPSNGPNGSDCGMNTARTADLTSVIAPWSYLDRKTN
jgi:hypothetical protein